MSGAQWVRGITESELKKRVGVATYFRGRSYFTAKAVRSLWFSDDVVIAVISGSNSKVYRAQLLATPDGWHASCSCPVTYDCKHVVAVILAVQEKLGPGPRVQPWERTISSLVKLDHQPARGDVKALALEVSVLAGGVPRVLVRPMREGVRTPWVQTGASWADIAVTWRHNDLNPDQAALLARLYQPSTSGFGHGIYRAAELDLADAGPAAWPTLRRIQAARVEFLPGSGLSSVELGRGEAEVALDITRTPQGGLTALASVLIDGEPLPVMAERDRVFLIGRPAHGLALLRSPGVLTLWGLESVPSEGMEGFINQQTRVEVPPADVDRFLTFYYPTLVRRGRVTSSDESVAQVEPAPPMLALDIAHGEGHTASLRWTIEYPTADEPVVVPLLPEAGGPPRDRSIEAAVVEPIAAGLVPYAVTHGMRPALTPESPLSGFGLVRFMTHAVPWLREQGVRVTERGSGRDYAEASEPPQVQFASDETEDRDWFNLHITITVDGQTVPFEPLFIALASGDDAMLLDSGTWFSLDVPELHKLRALIDEARELTDTPPGETLRFSALQAGLWEELVSLGVVARQSARWRESVEGLLSLADHSTEAVPQGVRASLRPYQVAGYRWLTSLWDARLGGVLADDMGLGKTLQTIAAFERARERGELDDAAVLVVAPASVVGTWVDEAARFAPDLKVVAITATEKRRGEKLEASVAGSHVVVTSYTLFRLEASEYHALSWRGLVLDEAQFVENHRSATYQAARRLGAPFTLAITGTPLENSLMDLWSMMSLAAPGLFAKPELFDKRYRKPIENDHNVEALAALRSRIRPFMLRRAKKDVVAELPDKIEQVLRIDLTPAHRKVYDKHLQRERQRVLGMLDDMSRNRVAIFRALTKLRQLALDPRLVDAELASAAHSSKVAALVEQVAELASEGHRALVFSSFTGYLKLVREALDEAGLTYAYLDGRTRDRPARIAQFREGNDPLFLISLKAGGFGLTLTEADYVFVLDPWWNPAAESQAIDRTHRIGQTRSVNVYRMVSTDTIEEKVVALQERKRDLFASVVDSGDFASGAITADDIRGLLTP